MSIFDEVVDRRNTRSVKWDMLKEVYNLEDDRDILPMWVADMDFKAPKEILYAIEEKLHQGVFGYSYVCESCKMAIATWHERRYNWSIDKETILFHHGVVPIIASVIETFTKVGDKVGMMSPVYPPFFSIPMKQQREIVYSTLIENDGHYAIDFDQLEELFKNDLKLFILCNPHNPAGIVWSKEDLTKLIDLSITYNVLLLSDEIHGDLVMKEYTHTPLLSLENATKAKIISAIAPTKTFNLAGIQAAMMVAPNRELYDALHQNSEAHGQTNLNVFASAAVQAAYLHGEEWLEELIEYVNTNMDYVIEKLGGYKGIKVQKPGSTYLMWIDYRALGLSEEVMMERLLSIGKLALEPGAKYGETGRGFLRINVGCSLATVKDGVERFKKALQ